MKKSAIDVQYGSKEKGNLWELKNVQIEVPETLKEWEEWITAEKCVRAIETYHYIRLQDFCRRMHNGGKNTKGQKDETIRELAKSFRLFENVRVASAPRAMTPAELKAHLMTMSAEDRAKYLEELMAE